MTNSLDGDVQKTKSTIVTDLELFKFKVLPVQLIDAGVTFQRLINQVLNGLQDFECAYTDAIAVSGKSWQDHEKMLGNCAGETQTWSSNNESANCKVGATIVPYPGHW